MNSNIIIHQTNSVPHPPGIQDNPQDNSIIALVEQILARAVSKHASDIHFEPYEKNYRIRFRIDGILYQEASIDINLAQRINSRLKVMAKLDIAERRLPQDGRFTIAIAIKCSSSHKPLTHDCRISTCPTMFGEKIVLRILNPNNMSLDITQIGLTPPQQKILLNHVKAPQGMILVTGPTGSGKTATLYTALNLLNTITHNISTAEDPVEINFPGINQVEINPKIGLNFATALRTFLRQDPDIIMVGEIRDLETAQIAIKAAQTGHLVLSTLHTNSAATSIIRLLNMDIAAFNLVGTLKLLIAQRLVRRLCPNCKQKITIPATVLEKERLNTNIKINTANRDIAAYEIFQAHCEGCEKCKGGYRGRIGIFEVLPMSPMINNILLKNTSHSALAIEQQACNEGMINLRTIALQRVLMGETSLEEINRIIL